MAVTAHEHRSLPTEAGTAYRAARRELAAGWAAGWAAGSVGLAQAELHAVTEQQIDHRHDAQGLEQPAQRRHPPSRRNEKLELEGGAIEDLPLDDEPGATELAPPVRGRPRMVGPDRRAASTEKPHYPLPQMIEPQAGAIGGGDYANSTRPQHSAQLAHNDRWIFDMLDHLVRGDVVENRVGKRQALERRLIKHSVTRFRPGDSAGQCDRGDVDPVDSQSGGQPP